MATPDRDTPPEAPPKRESVEVFPANPFRCPVLPVRVSGGARTTPEAGR
jgi:hypothetical protein